MSYLSKPKMLGPELSYGLCTCMSRDKDSTSAQTDSLSARVRWPRKSAFADAVDHAGCVQKGIHLIDQLFEIERDLDCLLHVAAFGAGFGGLGDAGCLFEPLPHFLEVGLERNFPRVRVHVRPLLRPHTCS